VFSPLSFTRLSKKLVGPTSPEQVLVREVSYYLPTFFADTPPVFKIFFYGP